MACDVSPVAMFILKDQGNTAWIQFLREDERIELKAWRVTRPKFQQPIKFIFLCSKNLSKYINIIKAALS